MVVLVFHTGDFILVERGDERVLVDSALIDQIPFFLLGRGAVDLNDSELSLRAALHPTIDQIVTSEHKPRFL